MDNFVFNVKDKVSFTFSLTPGGSQPSPPEPAHGGSVITGTPILTVNRASFGDEPLYGTPILVEE